MYNRISIITGLVLVMASATTPADLVLSAPPRETAEAGEKIYKPLAEYLSQVSGEKVSYRHSDTWAIYQAMITKDEYDLVFDGPHFVSWRIERLKHVPLAALAGKLSFVVAVRADETRVHTLSDLAGKGVCGHAPPNLATLTLFDQFSNPLRQPKLVETKGFDGAYQGLLSGKCVGTVLPTEVHRKLDGMASRTRILYESRPVPNQALTASPRVSEAARARIAAALLSPQAKLNAQPLAVSLGGNDFVDVTAADYKGHDVLLKNVWGFETRH